MIVISLSGKAGSGKDTVAKLLMERMTKDGLRVTKVGFADKLKDAACVMYGWDRARLADDAYYKEGGLGGWVPKNNPGATPIFPSNPTDPGTPVDLTNSTLYPDMVELDTDPICVALGMTRRTIMQRFGTECMRDNMHPDHWIILVQAAMARGEYDEIDVGFVTDARFTNELNFAKTANGLTVRIERVGTETLTQHTEHASEQQWQSWTDWDVVVANNVHAGLEVLRQTVVDLVYTRLVQNGIGRFPMPIQRALVNGSSFGAFSPANIYANIKPEDLVRMTAAIQPNWADMKVDVADAPSEVVLPGVSRIAQEFRGPISSVMTRWGAEKDSEA